MSAASQKVVLLVTVDDEYADRVSEVADRLRAAGMNVESLMELLGTITGSIDTDKVALISQVEGVAHFETSRQFQLAPPDSQIQ